MASTFYKYADRDTSSQVNWAEIGANISEDLRQQAVEREAQKALIDQQTRMFTNQLENNPMGDQTELNAWSMKYADSATKMMLIQEQLLKSGLLDFKDYTIQRQNLIDGTNQAYGLISGLNAEFNAVKEGIAAGTVSSSSLEFINSVEGFRNFTASELVINPTNYKVMVGNKKKDASGNYTAELEEGFTTVNALNNRIKKKVDRYYATPDLQAIAEQMGDLSMDIRNKAKPGRTGDITTFSGIIDEYDGEEWYKTMSKDQQTAYDNSVQSFLKAEDSRLEALLQNPDHVVSFMYDDLGTDENGTPYRIVFDDKSQTGPEVIHVTTNEQGQPQFEFTQDQKARVKEQMKIQLRGMYDKKKEIKTYTESVSYAPQRMFDQGAATYAQNQKTAGEAYDMFGRIRSGTPSEIETGMTWLANSLNNKYQGTGISVKNIQRTSSGLVVNYNNGSQSAPMSWGDSDLNFANSGLPLLDMQGLVGQTSQSVFTKNRPAGTAVTPYDKTFELGTPTTGGLPGGLLNINTGQY